MNFVCESAQRKMKIRSQNAVTFTGQYSHMNDSATDLGSAGFGLMFYNARWYDPMTGRFAQADSIVPGGVQGLDRYAYVNNSPVIYVDPTGHCAGTREEDPSCWALIDSIYYKYGIIVNDPYNELWTLKTLGWLVTAADRWLNYLGEEQFNATFNNVKVSIMELGLDAYDEEILGDATHYKSDRTIYFDPSAFNEITFNYLGENYTVSARDHFVWNAIHEFSHAVAFNFNLNWKDFADETGWKSKIIRFGGFLCFGGSTTVWTNPGTGSTPYAQTVIHPGEDLAESLAVMLMPELLNYPFITNLTQEREQWIGNNIPSQ